MAILIALLAPGAFAGRVLILNSYNHGNEWTDSQVRGIVAGLHGASVEHGVFVEYLDARRFDTALHEAQASLFASKYRQKPPDLIIATDDFAIDFVLERRLFFSLVPLIVSGANGAADPGSYQRRAGARPLAGVLEKFDVIETLTAAIAMRPNTTSIVTVGETDDLAYRQYISRAFPQLRHIQIRPSLLAMPEIIRQLESLDEDAVVLYSVFSQDAAGRAFTIHQGASLVTHYSPAPVYALNIQALGSGIVGGKLIDGFSHGHAAGKIAASVLSGTPANSIGLKRSENAFVFDHKALRRWGLDRSGLPAASRVINAPRSIVREHWKLAVGIVFCIAAQALIIALLVISRKRQSRLRMEAAASEARFRNLANAMPQMVWIADANGVIRFFNQRWQVYTGIDSVDTNSNDWIDTIHPDDRDDSLNSWLTSVQSRAVYEKEHRLRRGDGSYRWHLTRAVPVHPRDSREWFGTATDIDDQKNVEAQLRSANRDLEQFAYSASHDLQEPLRMVAIYCQLLKRRHAADLDAQGIGYLEYVIQGADRMNQLLQDLLAYTRMALSDRDPAAECNSEIVFHQVVEDLRVRLSETEGSIAASMPLPTVGAASIHVRQLFQNLFANAMKYRSDAKPRIVVGAVRDGHWWRFSVADNGIGISSAYHRQVFGLFRRLHVQSEYPGTGVGLALCEKIVSRYGGEIWVESELGRGSTFLFTLPAFVTKQDANSVGPALQDNVLVD